MENVWQSEKIAHNASKRRPIQSEAGEGEGAVQFSRVCDVNAERHVVLAKESQLATSRVIVKVGNGWRIRAAGRQIRSKCPACALTVAERIARYREQSKGRWRGNAHTTRAARPHSELVLGSVRVEVQNDAAVVTRC